MKKILMKSAICLMLFLIVTVAGASDCKIATSGNGETAASSSSGISLTTSSDEAYDIYPYKLEEDRKTFDASNIDIVVGENLYMTQINDWFMNFEDYEGKSVEIEGYYILIENYLFVGRLGPTCPYCTGGYVDFEFQTDQDVSGWVSGKTWIKVTGILRQGQMYLGNGKDPEAFYYIEAMTVEKMDAAGIDTVTN